MRPRIGSHFPGFEERGGRAPVRRRLRGALLLALLSSLPALGAESPPLPAFPEEGRGWDLVYSPIAREDFSTPIRSVGPDCAIMESGAFETLGPISGKASLRGSSTGAQGYLHYFNTRPEKLPLKAGAKYRLTLSYRIIEAGDKGFEFLFYSPTGGERGQWLPSLLLEGPAGKTGRAELEVKLLDFPDYRLWFNVVGKGSVLVDDIRLSEGGKIVFDENFETEAKGPGPGFIVEGGSFDAEGRLLFGKDTRIRTDPALVDLPRMSAFRLSFDYRFLSPPLETIALDVKLIPAPGAQAAVDLRPLLGNGESSGRFSTGFTTGSAGPYAILMGDWGPARLLVDNLLIEKGDLREFEEEPAAYAYLESAPFPRLGNYLQISISEQVGWGGFERLPWRSTVEALERRLALFDLVFGFPPRLWDFDPDLPGRIKRLNPHAVFLPYAIGQEWRKAMGEALTDSPDPDGDPGIRYDRGLSEEWFVRDTAGEFVNDLGYPGILKLNISPDCPRVGGQSFLEYQVESYRRLYFASGIWDGLFIDNLFAKMNGHIPTASTPEKLDYDINRNGKRDETPALLNRISYDAERRLLEGLIAERGNRELILGNNGPLPETRLAPYVNGYLFEGPSRAWEGAGEEARNPSEPTWRRALNDYRIMEERCRRPRINVFEAFGRVEDYAVPAFGRAEPTREDIDRDRFNLGTALLGDAFYEYDLTEARSSMTWFDEFAVEADGVARESQAGKGYLGQPLGAARELASPAAPIWAENFEGSGAGATGGGQGSRLSRKAGEIIGGRRSAVIEGGKRSSESWPAYETRGAPQRLERGRTYAIEFSWKVLEDLDYGLWFSISSERDKGGAELDARFAGEEGRELLPFTPAEDGDYVLRFAILSAGKVAIDDIRIVEGGVGPWRRDFENAFVLVNPYRVPARFDAAALAGSLGRTGIRRIRGEQAPEVNSGAPVTEGLELGPFDAIILLADRRPRD